MEKGDKPKTKVSFAKDKKPAKQKKPTKEKKPTKQKQKQKQKQENVQIVKVNVNTSKEEKSPLAKPVRKEITRQTTYITLDKPYALQPEEEELLTITKHVPNPPRDKSRAKVTTLVSDPKNEIPQANIQEQPIALLGQVPVPIKKKVTAKKKGLFDVPVEIYVGAKPVTAMQSLLDVPEPEILKVKPQKKPRKLKEPKYDVPIEIFEPKKRTVGKTVIFGEGSVEIFNPKTLAKTTEEEQALLSVAEEVTTKKGKRQKPVLSEAKSNSSSIDKSIQNSSINNNEKVQELVIAEPTISEKKTGLIISPKKPDLEEEVFDYITNTDDANISNPNSGEAINIQNENELEEEFGLTSTQLESYKEDYVMTAKGTVEGLIEEIESKSRRGRRTKYTSEEERKQAIKEQKKASAIRIREQQKIEEKKRGEKERLEGLFALMTVEDLTQDLGQDIVVSVKEKPLLTTPMKPDISSDFASVLVDKLSDNNNFGSVQSAQETQFEFE